MRRVRKPSRRRSEVAGDARRELEGAQRTSLFELAAREEACNLMRDLAELEIDARPRLEIWKNKSGV